MFSHLFSLFVEKITIFLYALGRLIPSFFFFCCFLVSLKLILTKNYVMSNTQQQTHILERNLKRSLSSVFLVWSFDFWYFFMLSCIIIAWFNILSGFFFSVMNFHIYFFAVFCFIWNYYHEMWGNWNFQRWFFSFLFMICI